MLNKVFCLMILMSLCSCAASGKQTGTTSVQNADTNSDEPPLDKRIYFFEHRFLPKLALESKGKFLADLLNADLSVLRGAATELVSPQYAKGLSVEVIDPNGAVLVQLANPRVPPDCYFLFIAGSGDQYFYLTYEKTMDLSGDGTVGMVGAWLPDGAHANFGPRSYRDAQSFLADVNAILSGETEPLAITK